MKKHVLLALWLAAGGCTDAGQSATVVPEEGRVGPQASASSASMANPTATTPTAPGPGLTEPIGIGNDGSTGAATAAPRAPTAGTLDGDVGTAAAPSPSAEAAGNTPTTPTTPVQGAGPQGAGPQGAGPQGAGPQGAGPQGAIPNCGSKLLPLPEDPAERGPWDVGVRTIQVSRLTVEVFYPAPPGSGTGQQEATYLLSDWLPKREQEKAADQTRFGVLGTPAYRDLPLDEEHGPYPAFILVHGTASFRTASASLLAHWASHGVVALGADHPTMMLSDMLAATAGCSLPVSGPQDLTQDVLDQLQALKNGSDGMSFLAGKVDVERLGIGGHSQGACATAEMINRVPGVQLVIPMAGSFPVAGAADLKSIMFASGIDDVVIGYNAPLLGNVVCPLFSSSDTQAYNESAGPPAVKKRLVGIAGGGHLSITDLLCRKNDSGKTSVEQAVADGVCGVHEAAIIGLPALADCGTVDIESAQRALNYATTAAIEETLLCQDRSAAFANMLEATPAIGDFQESL